MQIGDKVVVVISCTIKAYSVGKIVSNCPEDSRFFGVEFNFHTGMDDCSKKARSNYGACLESDYLRLFPKFPETPWEWIRRVRCFQ